MSHHVALQRTTDEVALETASPDAGAALIVALLLTVLLLALGASVSLVVDVDTTIAVNQRGAIETSYAAEGAVDLAIEELAVMADWTPALNGSVTSRLMGPAVLPPTAGGAAVDLVGLTGRLQQAEYAGAPWGADTPRWRVYGRGVPGVDVPALLGLPDNLFAVVWLSDDVAESDGDPFADENGVVVVRARAIGPRSAQADAQAVIARVATGMVRRISSRMMR